MINYINKSSPLEENIEKSKVSSRRWPVRFLRICCAISLPFPLLLGPLHLLDSKRNSHLVELWWGWGWTVEEITALGSLALVGLGFKTTIRVGWIKLSLTFQEDIVAENSGCWLSHTSTWFGETCFLFLLVGCRKFITCHFRRFKDNNALGLWKGSNWLPYRDMLRKQRFWL